MIRKKMPVLKPKKIMKPVALEKPKAAKPPELTLPKPIRIGAAPQLLRGMKDILPVDASYWKTVRAKCEELAEFFGYMPIETPIMEPRDLFVRGVGKQTDIVEKEMYAFTDQGGETIALRPENTAAIVRAYVGHGMVNMPQPVKLSYFGPFFRHDRPQAGRYRQFHQAGFEVLGDDHPVVDAELISLAWAFFKDLGISVTIQLNTIGCVNCRGVYRNKLVEYYKTKRGALCVNCRERLTRSPLRLLDCKEPGCETLKANAPQMLNHLDEACHQHFFKVVEYLDDLNLPYVMNPYIVRGLDYYNRTVFEIWPEAVAGGAAKLEESVVPSDVEAGEAVAAVSSVEKPEVTGSMPAQVSLGGGGRYDGLAELLGGRPTPAAGFALGIERVILAMKERSAAPAEPRPTQVFVAQLGEAARRKALVLLHAMRSDLKVASALSKDGLKPQLEIANRLGARYTVIVGQKEVIDGTAIVRDMEAGMQEVVPFEKVAVDLKRRFGIV